MASENKIFDDSWKITPDGKINWVDYGFLEGLEFEKKVVLGKTFNKIYSFLLKLPDDDSLAIKLKQYSNELTSIFPLIRRVFSALPLDKCELKSPKKFVIFYADYYNEYYPVFENRSHNSRCDVEAELIASLSKIITRTVMNNE